MGKTLTRLMMHTFLSSFLSLSPESASALKRTLVTAGLLALCWAGGLTVLPSRAETHPTPPAVETEDTQRGFIRYTLPKGSPLYITLQSAISTGVNQVDDPVEAGLSQTLYLDQAILLPRGTRFKGHISRLDLPIQGANAVLQIHFDEMRLLNGETIPIQAYVKTNHPDHTWGGELTPGTQPKKVVHTIFGIGQYNKTVMAGPRAMGVHIEWLPGERWTIILEQPLTLVTPK